jgi:alpha-1,2-mannosyltransferase
MANIIHRGICREFGVHIGRSWLILQLFAAGMFISSTALLPSSFSMYFTMCALSAWWHQQYKLAIFFTAISVLMGWPFVGLIALPILYDIIVIRKKIRTFVFWSIISGVTVLLPMIILDSSYYGKTVMAPVNIVLYNVFKKDGGPNLYGTEPFSFYIFNGFLNFNIIWLLSLLTPLALVIGYVAVPAKSKQSTLTLPYYISLAPYYLWLGVMMTQPHKEERFLFPVYPLVSLCGAITIDVCQKIFFRMKSAILRLSSATHYLNHTTFITVFFVIISVLLNVSRILALYRNYHAPMDVFMELSTSRDLIEDAQMNKIDVCIGKDWYRYPSSFFLPSTKYSIRFLKSEFRGMLPAYYSDEDNATQIVHNYFNDMNRENSFMYFDYKNCDFLVDLDLKSKKHAPLEPNYSSRTDDWKIVIEIPFLNAQSSHPIYRAFYIPFVSYKHIKYGSLNLLQRITPPTNADVESLN